MREFAKSLACRSRAHCVTCRSDPAWRARVGAPDECPYGVALEALPGPVPASGPCPLPVFVGERHEICDACPHLSPGPNMADGCLLINHGHSCSWKRALKNPKVHCPDKSPDGKWRWDVVLEDDSKAV